MHRCDCGREGGAVHPTRLAVVACVGCGCVRNVVDRFWARVDTTGECWRWLGNKGSTGYGVVKVRNGRELAHRVAWELDNALQIPDGMFVCHRCDNPICVRPSHLFLGTPRDNTRDMLQKGRNVRLAGVAHPRARLTEAQVLEIRKRYRRGSAPVLATEFGVHANTILRVVHGQRYGDIAATEHWRAGP